MKLARIDVFSHGMKLSGYGLRFAHLIGHYLRDRCLHLRKRRDPRTRRMVTDTINTYAAARSDYSEVYLLREQLKSFLDFIFSRGIRKEWLEVVYHDPVPGKEVEFVKKWKFPWREDQQEWLEYMDGGKDTPFRMSLNTAQTGSGKAVRLTTPVKVPGGWKPIGELQLGDQVIGADGLPTNVTAIFDHDDIQLYAIFFEDGRMVEACGDHLWRCTDPDKVLSTDEIMECLYDRPTRPRPIRIRLYEPKELVGLEEFKAMVKGRCELRIENGQAYLAVRTVDSQITAKVWELAYQLGGIAYKCPIDSYTMKTLIYHSDLLKLIPDGVEIPDDLPVNRLPGLAIDSIVPTVKAKARCITVDNDESLYVIKDHIVTHNTAMSQEIVFRRGVRTGIILSPRYMPGWRSSLLNFFGMEPGDVIEIRGNAKEDPPHPDIPRYSMLEFQTLVEQGELDFKIALFSLNMFQRYIADYEKNNCVAPYAFHPAEFWEKTGIGLLIHDECHEALHFLFKVKCYANIPEIIYLSATAVSDDPFIEQMLYLMYPKESRYAKGEYKKYIAVNAVTYRLRSTDKVRYKGFGGAYSHTIFEQSIMKNKQLKLAYFNFIYTVIIKGFMNQYQEGMKMLVYCATVDMCKSLSHYLSERIPELEIGPYTAEEDFTVLLDNDISVTTVKSAGTGIDLPDLVMTFMTLAMGSRTGNIQVLGRLRQLKGKFEGMTPTFWYLVCTSIEAHRKYHQRKVEFFSDKVLTQRVIDEDFEL